MKIIWYQTIPELGIKGRINTPEEFDKIGLPKDLSEKTVLDIGCNVGAFLVECRNRGAKVCGIESNFEWRLLAHGVLNETGIQGDPDYNFYLYPVIPANTDWKYDLVLLLSVTHVVEGMTGQEILDKAYELTKHGGLLIVEINDRLQKEKLKLPGEAVFYGKAKDGRSVYHVAKDNGRG